MRKLLLNTIFVSIINISIGYGLDITTHKEMNEKIAKGTYAGFSLDSHLINQLGIQLGIYEPYVNSVGYGPILGWLSIGGKFEDLPPWTLPYTRSTNHFHDPTITPLDETGFSGMLNVPFLFPGQSAVLWSQREPGTQTPGGYYSWRDVRDYFHTAITSSVPDVRNANFADTFRGLGQLMHLVQDMSVPEHTRDDGHYLAAYEEWVRETQESKVPQRRAIFDAALAAPVFFDQTALSQPSKFAETPVPIANLFDTNRYDGTNPGVTVSPNIGLAEYTNANFVSPDTIFNNYDYPSKTTSVQKKDYPYPDPFNSGSYITREYYKKVADGETGYRLAGVDYLWFYRLYLGDMAFNGIAFDSPIDDNVREDYAKLLLPRAVGYSAGLLNYFFRGTMELTLPDKGVYSIVGPGGDFKEIRVKAKNTSPIGEEMTDGAIQLVVKYKVAQQDPFQGVPVTTSDFQYITVPERNGARTLPRDNPVELAFDLSNASIPLWATDVYLQVVYKGKLGNEVTDAVAVGFKDISEPTPVYIINTSDYVCVNNNFVVAGSAEAKLDLDGDGDIDWSAYPYGITNEYVAFSSPQSPAYASPTNSSALFPDIPPGSFGSLAILTDYSFNISDNGSRGTFIRTESAVKNQEEYVTELVNGQPVTVLGRYYKVISKFRGVPFASGLYYYLYPYPSGTECDYSGLPAVIGPVSVQFP